MLFLICTCVLGTLFFIFYKKDSRNLMNAILFLAMLIMGYLALLNLTYQKFETFYTILLLFFMLLPLFGVLTSIFLIVNGIIILHKEGKSLTNSLSLLLGSSMIVYGAFIYIVLQKGYEWLIAFPALNYLFLFINYVVIVLTLLFVAFMLYSWFNHLIPKTRKYDYIIIHGAGLINGEIVTPLLAKRIDKAIKAYQRSTNKAVKIIASGGQGEDEKISEAKAIYQYLIEKGISKEIILLEEKSKTTYENLRYSKEIGDHFINNPRYLFVTNDYHVLRTGYYARRLNMKGDGLGCATASYYLPSAFIREYIALIAKLKVFLLIPLILFLIPLLISVL